MCLQTLLSLHERTIFFTRKKHVYAKDTHYFNLVGFGKSFSRSVKHEDTRVYFFYRGKVATSSK